MSTTDDNHQELILNSLPELIMLVDAKTWQVLYINEQMAKNIYGIELCKKITNYIQEMDSETNIQSIVFDESIYLI